MVRNTQTQNFAVTRNLVFREMLSCISLRDTWKRLRNTSSATSDHKDANSQSDGIMSSYSVMMSHERSCIYSYISRP
jgi:hypothetical protein